ncbi:hypothetical protein ABIE50_003412 [Chitinophaga sp. OAE865]
MIFFIQCHVPYLYKYKIVDVLHIRDLFGAYIFCILSPDKSLDIV